MGLRKSQSFVKTLQSRMVSVTERRECGKEGKEIGTGTKELHRRLAWRDSDIENGQRRGKAR